MRKGEEPSDPIGVQCFYPYPCGYVGRSGCDPPKPNIFDVGGMQLRTKLANYEKGIVSFEDISARKALKPDKLLQIQHELSDLPPYIDREKIGKLLEKLSYLLHFLDVGAFQPAVPLYGDSSPYEQLVFQYSLHCIECEGGELRHKEYLAIPGDDPRRGAAEQLCRDIPRDVCTLAYNMTFERPWRPCTPTWRST